MNLTFGQSSAVGPLPFADPVDAVGVALSGLVSLPTVPSGPAVPVAGVPNTSLLAQAVADVEGAAVGPDGRLVVDPVHLAHDGDRTGWSLDDSAFAMFRLAVGQLAGGPEDDAPDALRVPFLGPVSLALALHEAGVPLVRAAALARDVVVHRAVALCESARAALPGTPLLMVMSEPALAGSHHPTFPLRPAEIRSLLAPVVESLDAVALPGPERGATPLLIGVHVEGPTDWATVVASGVSLLSFPVEHAHAAPAAVVAAFLDAGGWIDWGVVPVDRPLGSGDELHWKRLNALWCTLVGGGADPMLLRTQALVSPAGGLDHFAREQVGLVLELTGEVALRIRHQAVASRLALGA
ncbi:MAG: hypothetical protein ACKO04_13880 [Actinomycetes bacterium]